MNNGKELFILGFILILLGILITPFIAASLFGPVSTCSHTNMYLVGLSVILIGFGFVYIGWKKK